MGMMRVFRMRMGTRFVQVFTAGGFDARLPASEALQNSVCGVPHRDADDDFYRYERQEPNGAFARRQENNKRFVAGGEKNRQERPDRDIFLLEQFRRHDRKPALGNQPRRGTDERPQFPAQTVIRTRQIRLMLDELDNDINQQQPREKFERV